MGGFNFPQPFNINQLEGNISDAFTGGLVPAGDYPVYIKDSESKATSDNTGARLVLWLEVMPEHPNRGHKFMWNLNLFNKSSETVAISQKQLKALCTILGVFDIRNSAQLHNIPFIVTVNNDGQFNNVKAIKDRFGNLPGQQAQAPQGAPAFTPAPQAPAYQPPLAPAAPAPMWQPPPPAPAQPAPPMVAPAAWQAPTALPPAAPAAAPPWATQPQSAAPTAAPAAAPAPVWMPPGR